MPIEHDVHWMLDPTNAAYRPRRDETDEQYAERIAELPLPESSIVVRSLYAAQAALADLEYRVREQGQLLDTWSKHVATDGENIVKTVQWLTQHEDWIGACNRQMASIEMRLVHVEQAVARMESQFSEVMGALTELLTELNDRYPDEKG